jgi:hypothetical protein
MSICVVVVVLCVDIDRWQSLVGHVDGRQGVLALVLPLDRIAKLHRARELDGNCCVVIRSLPVADTPDGSV